MLSRSAPRLARLDDERLVYQMARRGITATQLAEAAGMDKRQLSLIRRRGTVEAPTLRRLAVALESFPPIEGASSLLAEPGPKAVA